MTRMHRPFGARQSAASAAMVLILAACGGSVTDRTTPSRALTPPASEPSPSQGSAPVGEYEWRRVDLDGDLAAAEGLEVRDMVATDDGFVAVGLDEFADADLEFGADGATAGGFLLASAVAKGGEPDDTAAAVLVSADGRTWVRLPHDPQLFGGPGRQLMWSIAAGENGLVAVGWEHFRSQPDPVPLPRGLVWTSPDGRTWSRVSDADGVFADAFIRDVVATSNGYVAVGGKGHEAAIWRSSDGRSWTRVVAADEGIFRSESADGIASLEHVVVGVDGTIVALGRMAENEGSAHEGDAYTVWTSTDGTTWARRPFAAQGSDSREPYDLGDGQIYDLAATGDGYVAIGSVGVFGPQRPGVGALNSSFDAAVWQSKLGTSWLLLDHDESVFGGAAIVEMTDLARSDHGLIGIGWESPPEEFTQLRNVVAPVPTSALAVWSAPSRTEWQRIGGSAFGRTGPVDETTTSFRSSAIAIGPDGTVVILGLQRAATEWEWTLAAWTGVPTG